MEVSSPLFLLRCCKNSVLTIIFWFFIWQWKIHFPCSTKSTFIHNSLLLPFVLTVSCHIYVFLKHMCAQKASHDPCSHLLTSYTDKMHAAMQISTTGTLGKTIWCKAYGVDELWVASAFTGKWRQLEVRFTQFPLLYDITAILKLSFQIILSIS